MVALGTRVIKLEKKLANRSQTGPFGDRVMYQASEEELAEVLAILVKGGAVREVRS